MHTFSRTRTSNFKLRTQLWTRQSVAVVNGSAVQAASSFDCAHILNRIQMKLIALFASLHFFTSFFFPFCFYNNCLSVVKHVSSFLCQIKQPVCNHTDVHTFKAYKHCSQLAIYTFPVWTFSFSGTATANIANLLLMLIKHTWFAFYQHVTKVAALGKKRL